MTSIAIDCPSQAATEQFAETLCLALRVGDLVALDGDLGAGKTTLARALIRTAAKDPLAEVPSPTFTLVQQYNGLPFGALSHLDLYRIEDAQELEELGIDEALVDGVVLVEWPDKGAGVLPTATLHLAINHASEDGRTLTLTGDNGVLERVRRSMKIRGFLDHHEFSHAIRYHFMGDASARAYEKIHTSDSAPVILMNAPAQPDGPPIKNGLPYSRIAHLAEDMSAYAGVTELLNQDGFRVPEIIASDLDEGILLIEDLGDGSIIDDQKVPIEDRYSACVETLALMHQKQWSSEVALTNGSVHQVPPFDREALLIEVDLLAQWYAPYKLGRSLTKKEQDGFNAVWNDLIDELETSEKSLVLRDFHSPNVIWIDSATGTDRVGLIDFQDALIGPAAYDLASLAQDARVDVSAELETRLVDQYCAARQAQGFAEFDETRLRKDYAIMAAERATKVLGIFVRLSQRDGKHGYLAHMPRIQNYLSRSFEHPALANYRDWFETVFAA